MENNMNITVNPFTREIVILHTVNDVEYEKRLSYDEIDEWNSFETDKQYDIHLLYDSGLDVSVYEVVGGKVDYTKNVKHKTNVIY